MSVPFFYVDTLEEEKVVLGEETSRHIVQVLRMKKEEEVGLTDGKGTRAKGRISNDNRKHCEVLLFDRQKEEAPVKKVTIAISLLKNAARFEWFLEKATEIGVTEIIPLICQRTEKEKFRLDRLNAILISAMLQSQQCRLPLLWEPISFQKIIDKESEEQKFIAHCLPEQKAQLSSLIHHHSSVILIGPEGDFTENEIKGALQKGFQPVALGNTRLRSETAGIVAATLLCNGTSYPSTLPD